MPILGSKKSPFYNFETVLVYPGFGVIKTQVNAPNIRLKFENFFSTGIHPKVAPYPKCLLFTVETRQFKKEQASYTTNGTN